MVKEIYDAASEWYESMYIDGDDNKYMKDERAAAEFWKKNKKSLVMPKIVSLGVGSGQDISILGYPSSTYFTGYDISPGMLKNARTKFPDYTFIEHDCNTIINTQADVLVSMFGTPNYIGINGLLMHYIIMECKHAFFIFYGENYKDGLVENYTTYSYEHLKSCFWNATVTKLNDNYNIVSW
jgi:hypothetical protein